MNSTEYEIIQLQIALVPYMEKLMQNLPSAACTEKDKEGKLILCVPKEVLIDGTDEYHLMRDFGQLRLYLAEGGREKQRVDLSIANTVLVFGENPVEWFFFSADISEQAKKRILRIIYRTLVKKYS